LGIAQVDAARSAGGGSSQLPCQAKQQRALNGSDSLPRLSASAGGDVRPAVDRLRAALTAAHRATPKAAPASNGHAPGNYRLRYDRLEAKGEMRLRRAGRMHHLAIGAAHARKRVLAFADEHRVTVAELTTGEILSIHQIEPDKTYRRNQNKKPGRWPSSPAPSVAKRSPGCRARDDSF
jgi:hypothetical protein